MRSSSSVLLLAAVAAVPLAACGKSEPTNDGVNDVRKACELRNAWKNARAEKCGLCQGAAPQPACGCESFKGFDGVCAEQGQARRAEPSCTYDLDSCVALCKDDCACIEGCYANAPECKRVSAARDGCVALECSRYCD